jgi:hypothetical protein
MAEVLRFFAEAELKAASSPGMSASASSSSCAHGSRQHSTIKRKGAGEGVLTGVTGPLPDEEEPDEEDAPELDDEA